MELISVSHATHNACIYGTIYKVCLHQVHDVKADGDGCSKFSVLCLSIAFVIIAEKHCGDGGFSLGRLPIDKLSVTYSVVF